MICETFLNYYNFNFKPLDLDVKKRGKEQASDWEVINLEQTAQQHAPPKELKASLDKEITQDVYNAMIAVDFKADQLSSLGFQALHIKRNTRVFESICSPGWLIKIRTTPTTYLPMKTRVALIRAQNQLSGKSNGEHVYHQNILRAAGREYFMKHLDFDDPDTLFSIPQEYVYKPLHASSNASEHHKYFSISEKVDLYSGRETVEILKKSSVAQQKIVAQKVVALTKATRFHDWHSSNLVLRKDTNKWNFCLMDTEPLGILIAESDPGAHLFDPIEHVLVGLLWFRGRYCNDEGLTAMTEEADRAIVDYIHEHPKSFGSNLRVDHHPLTQLKPSAHQIALFVTLVIFSILIPLIPLALFLRAVDVNHRPGFEWERKFGWMC